MDRKLSGAGRGQFPPSACRAAVQTVGNNVTDVTVSGTERIETQGEIKIQSTPSTRQHLDYGAEQITEHVLKAYNLMSCKASAEQC